MTDLDIAATRQTTEPVTTRITPVEVMGATSAAPYLPGAVGAEVGAEPPPWRATLRRRATPLTVVAELPDLKDLRWQEPLNDLGAGSFVLANDDPALELIHYGDLVLIEINGMAAFTMIVRELNRIAITEGEEAAQLTTVSGPSSVAILDEALVYGARPLWCWPIEEERHFNWTTFDYWDAWWQRPVIVAGYRDLYSYWSQPEGEFSTFYPEDFPDKAYGAWQWAHGATRKYAEPGTCYFRGVFNVGAEFRKINIYTMVDNIGQIYFDGQHLDEVKWEGHESKTLKTEVETTPGLHIVAIEAHNAYNEAAAAVRNMNPAGVLMSIYGVHSDGNDYSESWATVPIFRSDAFVSWSVLPYPPHAPGMTAGEALVHCVREAQGRGALAGLTLAFNDKTDSAGKPWPLMGDVSTRIGYDVLTFCKELAATYIDFAMAPASLTLYAWAKDGRGRTTTVSLHGATDPNDPDSGNLRQLSHKRVS